MTEPDFLRNTREGYDLTAAMYADRFHGHLDDKPFDRAVLAGFTGLLKPGSAVADVGCGTGATTRSLPSGVSTSSALTWRRTWSPRRGG